MRNHRTGLQVVSIDNAHEFVQAVSRRLRAFKDAATIVDKRAHHISMITDAFLVGEHTDRDGMLQLDVALTTSPADAWTWDLIVDKSP